MTLDATVVVDIEAKETTQSGLTTSVIVNPIRLAINVGDCQKTLDLTRTFPGAGLYDVSLAAGGISTVKLLYVRNLSSTSSIAMTAGWNGTDFRNFVLDYQSWNFAPMVNLGSLTLRGYPIRPGGVFMLSCPNSDGFSTTSGGDILRIGGVAGQQFQIFVMGT